MRAEIDQQLRKLAAQRQIRILMAVESGSRAWGFPSPDSDYDVRIVYVHQPEWYLSIRNRKDNIDYFHGELLDINGWDLRKALSLLRKSNATPFEWAQSPIIYQEMPGFRTRLLELAQAYFQPYHSLNHYKGIAHNSYQLTPFSGEIKLKKLFYVLRPILAAKWIQQRRTIPPMQIQALFSVLEDEKMITRLLELIAIKKDASEGFVYTLDPDIKAFVEQEMERLTQLTPMEKRSVPEVEKLDVFFREMIYTENHDD